MSLDPKRALLAYSSYVAGAEAERRRMREALAMFIAGALSLKSAGIDPVEVLQRQTADMQRGIGRKLADLLGEITTREERANLGLASREERPARQPEAAPMSIEAPITKGPDKSGSDIPPPPVVEGSYRSQDAEPIAFDLVDLVAE